MVRRKKAKGNMGEQSGATATAAAAEPAAVSATDSTTTRREAAPAKKQPQPLRMLVLRPSVGLPLAQTALELRAYKQRLLDGDATLADDSTLVLVVRLILKNLCSRAVRDLVSRA